MTVPMIKIDRLEGSGIVDEPVTVTMPELLVKGTTVGPLISTNPEVPDPKSRLME